jgi:DNA processing protein
MSHDLTVAVDEGAPPLLPKIPQISGSPFELEPSDADFPSELLEVEQAPKRLYGIGAVSSLTAGIGIIGARNATPYGRKIAHTVAGWAAELGLTVYSGCARGCDQAAHRGALEAGGKTVAVLGCGADVPYPKTAVSLLNEIAQNGAVVSSYPWGMPPLKHQFIERNRLIVLFSQLLVVVEARIPSGTFSTVNHALDLGVPIAAFPGSIFCLESAGPNRLIAEGATLLSTREDFLVACNRAVPEMRYVQPRLFEDESEASPEGQSVRDKVLRAITSSPLSIDELILELDEGYERIVNELGALELNAQVVRYPGGRYGSVSL